MAGEDDRAAGPALTAVLEVAHRRDRMEAQRVGPRIEDGDVVGRPGGEDDGVADGDDSAEGVVAGRCEGSIELDF